MTKKIKPNDPCPCGSGKKYKKCCFSINEQIREEVQELDIDESLSKCANCGKYIGPGSEIFSLGAKLRPGIDLSNFAGKVINLPTLSRTFLPVIVPGLDSEAIQDGNDILITICSRECGLEMKKLLKKEREMFFGFNFN